MNPKTLHILLDIGSATSLLATAITAQPALNVAKWVPTATAILSVIAIVCKGLTIGNIPPTNPTITQPPSVPKV